MTILSDLSPVVPEFSRDRMGRLGFLANAPDDGLQLVRLLNHTFSALQSTPIGDTQSFAQVLEEGVEVVITDECPGWTSGLAVLQAVKTRQPHCAVIMCVATGSVEVAVAAMKAGLDDCLVKDAQYPERLVRAVREALQRVSRRQAESRQSAASQRRQSGNTVWESEARYRTLFEEVPISLWEEDHSGVMTFVEALRARGVDDIPGYLREHPEAVARCADLVHITDVNAATLQLFQIPQKTKLLGPLSGCLVGETSYDAVREVVSAFVGGKTRCEIDFIIHTPAVQELHVHLKASIARGHEDTWDRVLVSLADTTKRRLAELELQARVEQLETVRTVTTEITRELDLTRLLDLIVHRAVELVDAADRGAIWLWDETHQVLRVQSWTGQEAWPNYPPQRLGEGAVGAAAQQRHGLLVHDYQHSPYAIPTTVERTGATAVLVEPLLYRTASSGLSCSIMAVPAGVSQPRMPLSCPCAPRRRLSRSRMPVCTPRYCRRVTSCGPLPTIPWMVSSPQMPMAALPISVRARRP